MSMSDDLHAPTLSQLTFTFVPFALLLALSIVAALAEPEVLFARTHFTVWAMIVLTTPALCVFAVRFGREPLTNWWQLYWTFGYLAYLAHFYFGFWVMFGADLAAVFASQGILVAGSNFALTALWGGDVILSWVARRRSRINQWVTLAAHLFAAVSMFVSAIVFKAGTVRILGVMMTIAVFGAIAIRLLSGRARNRVATAL